MLSPRNLLLAVLLFSLFVPLGNAVTWTSIDYPGARNTTAWGINSAGQIVGSYYNPGPDSSHCFLYVNGTMTSFDYPGASLSAALGINDSGQIVGYYYNANSVQQHGFFFDGTTYTTIDPPNATLSYLTKINNFGQMVVFYVDQTNTGHMFEYDVNTGVFTTLQGPRNASLQPGGINNPGDMVGVASTALLNGQGFLLSGGTYRFFTVPQASYTFPQAINDSGEIVGYVLSSQHGSKRKVFIFLSGNSLLLDYPGGPGFTEAQGVNNAGAIVGFWSDWNGDGHAFLRTP
jgi:probable HAF family extracellular repeat protein